MRIFWIFLVLFSCESPITPKQSAFFAPEFGASSHNSITTECNYSFLKNKIARIQYLDNCNFNIVYDNLNAKIFFSSINVNNNFPDIIKVFDERIIENSANVTEVKVSEYTDDQILNSYKKIMKKIHPDKNPELNRLAVIVNQAKDTLIKNTT